MVPRTREQALRCAISVRSVVVTLAGVLVLSLACACSATAATKQEAALRERTDASLVQLVADLDRETQAIGQTLLDDDETRTEIEQDREIALDMLAAWLTEAYKRDGAEDVLAHVLTANSLEEAADRLRVARTVSEHQSRLVRALDQSKAQLAVGQLEHARLVTRLEAVQTQLVAARAEQDRRAMLRAEHARERAAREAAAAERAEVAAAEVAASAPGALVALPQSMNVVPNQSGPPTAQGIDAYLASKGSPMFGQGAAFMASAQRWQVDPRLLVAIAGAESSFGQVTCGPNNAWGWACPNDPADFQTWADGIDTVTKGLRNYYLDEGRTSVTLIQQKYCPVGAANDPTGLNSHWAQNVTKFLLEQGGNPSMVGPGPTAGFALPDLGGLGIVAAD